MRLGFGLGVTAPVWLRPPSLPAYADPDLNTALAFKQKVLSYDLGTGDRAAQLFAAFPALKAYLNVGHKSQTLAPGSSHPNWSPAGRIDVVTGAPVITGYDIAGQVLAPTSCAANVIVEDCHIRAKQDGTETSVKVQKDNDDTLYVMTTRDCTLENGQACDPNRHLIQRVLHRFSAGDNFKVGSSGGATRPQRIEMSWGEACGYGNPGSHGDGLQASTTGDARVVAVGLYSSPIVKTADAFDKYTGPYSTGSYGLTNAIRIDASGAPKLVERVHYLGIMSAFGSGYPIGISAQQVDSVVRNITVAHSVFAPKAFRYDACLDARQIHPAFTDNPEGGLIENVAFVGNTVFGYGPVEYADRGGASLPVEGIWHWNPATLDTATLALWKDLGVLTSAGLPASGMLRSVAGTIANQPRTIATTGAVPLNLDLSGVPADASITIHLAAGLPELEFVA